MEYTGVGRVPPPQNKSLEVDPCAPCSFTIYQWAGAADGKLQWPGSLHDSRKQTLPKPTEIWGFTTWSSQHRPT